MAKAAKILLIVLAAVLVLLISAAMLVQTQWARETLEEQLSQRLDDRKVEIASLDVDWGWPLGIRAEGIKVANAEWAEQPYMLELDALQVQLDSAELLGGSPGLQLLELERPRVHLSRRADGRSNWDALTDDSDEDSEPPVLPDSIRIHDGQLTYRDAALDVDLTLDIATTDDGPGQRQLSIEGRGSAQGKPLTLSLTGGPPAEALATDAPYAVKLDAQLGETRMRFDGQAAQLPQLDELQGRLAITAPDAAELSSLVQPIDIPAFELDAQLRRDGERWALEDLELHSGESRLSGSLAFEQGATPALTVQLQGDQLDLNRWGVMPVLAADRESPGGDQKQSLQQRVGELLQPLRRYRGTVDISLDRLTYGDATLSEVVLKGTLAGEQLQIERLHAAQGEGTLSASGAFDLTEASLSGNLDLTIDQLDLGQALGPLGYPELGTLDGELHAQLAQNVARISNTHLHYDAPAQALRIEVDAQSTDAGLRLEGDAWRNQVPLHFELNGGPLETLFDDQAFPVEGTLTSRESRLSLDGSLTDPLQLQAADVQVSLQGPSLANLNPLTGLDLPSLGPYQLNGQLSWKNRQLRLQDLRAQWGESDLSGDIRLSLSGRPMLWANLFSDTLNTADLKVPGTPTDPTDAKVFSDHPLGLDALRDRDAIIRYEAQNVRAEDIPLNALDLKIELDEGLLLAEPLQLSIGKGRAQGRLRLDTRAQPPAGELHLTIERVRLRPVLREAGLPQVAQDSAGTLGGKLDWTFEGRSLGEMAAALDGTLELAMSGGKLDMLAVELLGLDAGEAAVAALADSDQVPMNCTYLRFDATQGNAELEQLFISTRDSNITGGGSIDLASERLDLTVESRAKDFSLLSGNSPVQLQGTLKDPQVSVVTGELVARALASVAGALIAPPLAILPWIEAGLGEGSGIGCRQALAEFERNRD